MAQIGELRKEINELLQLEEEKKAIFLKQSYYEAGPREAKSLARRMRKQQINNLMSKLHDPKTNKSKYDPKDIERIFRYYEKLYKQTSVMDRSKVLEFLNTLDQPSIGDLQKCNCRNNQ